jgi:hypothetical protein
MSTFVLVHGSCHGGWCWKKVIPILCKDGYPVYTPTLTGLGERSHLVNRDIGLHIHILDIIQVFEFEDLDEVILVGQKIKRLVYLDGYIPQDNKSAFDLEPGLETLYKERALREQGKEWLVASYKPEEFGVTNRDDKNWMSTRLSPMPWHTHDQSIRILNPLAKTLPKSYICCSAFGNSQFKTQRSPADWDYHELMKGHDVMITAPEELTQLLEALELNSS